MQAKHFGHDRRFATPWTVAHQAPLSTKLSRREYWSGLLFRFSRGSSDPGIEPGFPALRADFLPAKPSGKHQTQVVLCLGQRKEPLGHLSRRRALRRPSCPEPRVEGLGVSVAVRGPRRAASLGAALQGPGVGWGGAGHRGAWGLQPGRRERAGGASVRRGRSAGAGRRLQLS